MSSDVGKVKKKKNMMKKLRDNPDGTAEYRQVEVGVDGEGNIVDGADKLLSTPEEIDAKSNGTDTEEVEDTGIKLPEDKLYFTHTDLEEFSKLIHADYELKEDERSFHHKIQSKRVQEYLKRLTIL